MAAGGYTSSPCFKNRTRRHSRGHGCFAGQFWQVEDEVRGHSISLFVGSYRFQCNRCECRILSKAKGWTSCPAFCLSNLPPLGLGVRGLCPPLLCPVYSRVLCLPYLEGQFLYNPITKLVPACARTQICSYKCFVHDQTDA